MAMSVVLLVSQVSRHFEILYIMALVKHTCTICDLFKSDDSRFPLLRELHKTLFGNLNVYEKKDMLDVLFCMQVMNNLREQVFQLFIMYEDKFPIPREIIKEIKTVSNFPISSSRLLYFSFLLCSFAFIFLSACFSKP